MSLEDLFGSDSENSDNGRRLSTASMEDDQLPSTQAHMQELFGGSDDESENRQIDSDNESMASANKDESNSIVEQAGEEDARINNEDEPELNFSNSDEDNEKEEQGSRRNSPDTMETDDIPQTKNNDDSDDNEDKVMPTTQDLFGEELDVSSDEDEQQDTTRPSQDENENQKTFGDRDDEDERPPTPEKEDEGLSIAIELPRCNMSLGKDLYFIKLPNFLSVDTKPFDPNFYEDEIDDDEVLDEEGRARLKLKVENTIRWRYTKDKDGNEVKESNSRIVRWSDGSLSMHLGNEVFDIFKMPIQGEQNHLFVQQGTGLQAQAVFKNKLTFRPHSTSSQTHRKMTMSIAERMAKAQKIKMMPATERDPETQRNTLIKKEDERLRAQNRRESQQRRMREKSHAKGLSANYLEQDMDDEEDFDESLAAIKNKYKKDVKGARSKPFHDVYSDEDSDDEEKLRSAKLDINSDDDDDDLEIKRKREELARKKKSSRKIIEESDDDGDDDSG